MFSIAAVVLLAFGGAAIDYSRWNNINTQTQIGLDAAVLAAARELQISGDLEKSRAAGEAYFNEHVKSRFEVASSTVTFELTDNNTAMIGHATASVRTPLMGLANVPDLPVNANAKAAFSVGGGQGGGSNLEISLMLDVTGSMCANGEGPCTSSAKLTALKDSAKDLINVVIKDGPGQQTTRVALVPFATRVRVSASSQSGSDSNRMQQLTDLNKHWSGWYNMCTNSSGGGGSEGDGGWVCHAYVAQQVSNWELFPCVTDRTGPQEFTDAAPGANAWLNAHDGGRFPLSWDSSDSNTTGGKGTSSGNPADHWNYSENEGSYCSDAEAANTIMPLTNDKVALIDRIDGLQAYGATAGALGTAWSWYMLSPKWSNIWNGQSAPGAYSDLTVMNGSVPKLRKIAVLMTDGVYNARRGWKEQDPVEVSGNAVSICDNMKAEGIEVFTVGFDLDSLPAADRTRAIETLQACGTDLDHFYNTLDAAELQQAFNSIALSLSTLYLAK